MKITLKNKEVQRHELLDKIKNIKYVTGVVSRQIKDCIQPQAEIVRNVIINLNKIHNNRRILEDSKQSLETTASSISTRYQSVESTRKIIINNPETHTVLKEHLNQLNYRGNRYQIRWRNSSLNISKAMRVILGEWLMQLAQQLQIPKDAVYNAIHYTDKYVGMVHVGRAKYQSVGLCALFLASKLEISAHPNINAFIQAMDGTISKEELVALQKNMVIKLKFKLNPPTLYQYMILLVSLFNNFCAKSYPGYLQITRDSELYKTIFWMLDGIFLDNEYRTFGNKEKICLSILYLAIKKYKCYKPKNMKIKRFNQDQLLAHHGEFERVFDNFLTKVIQVFKRVPDLQQCVAYYKKWLKYDRCTGNIEDQIEQLKKIILSA